MDIKNAKAAMIEQYKKMCEEFSKTPQIEEPISTCLGPIWETNAIVQRRFAAGRCEGARRLLKQILTEDEYNQLTHIADDVTKREVR